MMKTVSWCGIGAITLAVGWIAGCKLHQIGSVVRADETAPAASPFRGKKFWKNPNSSPAQKNLSNISPYPMGTWIRDEADVSKIGGMLSQAGDQLAILVIRNYPGLACLDGSSDGKKDISAYPSFIENVAKAIGDKEAIVILEPDVLAFDKPGCPLGDGATSALGSAVSTLKTKSPKAYVYIDIGNDDGFPPLNKAVSRLLDAKVENAAGFALNVANFVDTTQLIARGRQISAGLKEKLQRDVHFVIDTSRNGNGAETPKNDLSWCNPKGRALGIAPTADTGDPLVDAYLWVKVVGESDGECERGEPPVGQWFEEYAQDLNRNPPKSASTNAAADSKTPSKASSSSGDSEGLVGQELLESIKSIIGSDASLPRDQIESKPFMGSFANIKSKDDPNFAKTGYCMTDNHCGHMDAYSRSDVPLSDLQCNKFCYVDRQTRKYKPSTKYTAQNPPSHYLCCGWETCD